jgi:hypothetical protein
VKQPTSQLAVELAERFADGRATERELELIWQTSLAEIAHEGRHISRSGARAATATCNWYVDPDDVYEWLGASPTPLGSHDQTWSAAKTRARHEAAWNAADEVLKPSVEAAATRTERQNQIDLLRDIFGNPFRSVTIDPSWPTPAVTSLAAAIYEERHMPSGHFDNHRMGVLADALEDAGCDNAEILGHLRSDGEHVRGCWAVDLLLGRE